MELTFKDKTVFLTGGSRGIGAQIKQSFSDNGAVVYAPSREEMDLSNPESVSAYIEANSELQTDIFIHCAGINELFGIEEITPETMEKAYRVNVSSAVQLIKAFVPGMKKKETGKIVFISSLYSVVSKERRLAYSSSKSALLGTLRTLALELAPYHIMVNAVAPGYVFTQMTKKNLSEQDISEIKKNIPTGQFQEEKEIADAVMFLCSDCNHSITGQQLVVDGGFLCR